MLLEYSTWTGKVLHAADIFRICTPGGYVFSGWPILSEISLNYVLSVNCPCESLSLNFVFCGGSIIWEYFCVFCFLWIFHHVGIFIYGLYFLWMAHHIGIFVPGLPARCEWPLCDTFVNGPSCGILLWMAHHVVSFCEWPMWCLSVNGPCGVFLWMAHRPIICYLSVNGPSAHRLVSFCIVWYSAEVSCYLPERDDGNVVQICLLMDNLIICWWCQWVSDLGVYSINEWQFVNEWWMSLLSDC